MPALREFYVALAEVGRPRKRGHLCNVENRGRDSVSDVSKFRFPRSRFFGESQSTATKRHSHNDDTCMYHRVSAKSRREIHERFLLIEEIQLGAFAVSYTTENYTLEYFAISPLTLFL